MTTYRLRCLGGDEPWTESDLAAAEASVKDVLVQWGRDELKHEFGYGNGESDAHCNDHDPMNPQCEACADAEYEWFDDLLHEWIDEILHWMWPQLQTTGYVEIRKGDERIWFSMSIRQE